ncbi:MCE family protein [Mycobacterium paraffinicum]|uniref:MCE family protein n=1 Tax=Mycobacterium paraffinicum TaxID=53378 RepID=A0ABP8F2R4_9MYCO|nr:MCE family protein [Mycobacterium paraffinicum]MCV7313505.1 MCE family protein [Mycobacterium paraffinicum]
MISRKRLVISTAVVLVGLIAAATLFLVRQAYFAPKSVTAYFTTAVAVYPGDQVRVAGVEVGTITSIQPDGTDTRMTMHVDRAVPVPADAKAIIVAPSLIGARYVQLTPPYRSSGPVMADGAVIPLDRTAVPVEWDEVKAQLTRLATELGPNSQVSTPAVSRFIESAANAMGGNGEKLRQMINQLSGVGRILADGHGNIADIIKNLQTFVTALRGSDEQIVQFQGRLATLTSVVNDSKSDLDAALTDLSIAVGDVQRFIAGSRDQTSEQLNRLTPLTQTLVDRKIDLENVLHISPTAFSNFYNFTNPDSGSYVGTFVLNNFSNPVEFLCGAIGGIANATAPETAKLCADYLGPALRLPNFNNLPFAISPLLNKAPDPDKVIYADPDLAPGGAGGKPSAPEIPPAVSAYAGLPGDYPNATPPPAPPARVPGLAIPEPPPTTSMPAPPPSLPDILMPADRSGS